MFQSRNRGAFGFKFDLTVEDPNIFDITAFQSRNRGAFGFKDTVELTFTIVVTAFQSRNRGAFGFKGTLLEVLLYVL